jgi:hypothetical protein
MVVVKTAALVILKGTLRMEETKQEVFGSGMSISTLVRCVVWFLIAAIAGLGQGAPAAAAEFRVNSTIADAQYSTYKNKSVAVDSDGDFVITWMSYFQDGDAYGVYAQRYNSHGVAQGSEFRVNTTTTGDQYGPVVAMDSVGNFVIAWQSYGQDGSEYGIYAQRYNSSGVAQGSEFQVNTYTGGQQDYPSIAMDSDGDFVITWQSAEQDGYGYGIYAQRYSSSGVAQGSEFQVNTSNSSQSYPAVAMDSSGDFVICWMSFEQDGQYGGIYAQRYNSSGVAQGSEFQVNTYTDNFQDNPSIAMDNDGDFVITWQSEGQDGDGYGVFAQRYNSSGVAQGGEFQVNTTTANEQSVPSIAMDNDGDFVITWQSYGQDGDGYGVFAQRYNSSGVAQGSEFQVNSHTTYDQSQPSIAMDSIGKFIITWSSYEQDGNGWGVFAKRFNPNNTAPVARGDSASLNEDGSIVINVLANDTDANGDIISITGATYGARGSTQGTWNGTVSNSGPWNGILYTPDGNYFGTDSFTYSITDEYGGTATATVKVNVLPVNDAPSFTKGEDQTVNEDAGLQTVSDWAIDISKGFNEPTQSLSFIVTTDNSVLFATRPQVSPTGTLTYKPAPNKNGTATVTVTLRDSGGTQRGGVASSAPQTFTITVNPVNDAPLANAGPDQSFTQTGVLTNVRLNGSASNDIDGDALTYQWKKGTTAIASTATTTVALAPGRHTFTLLVTDPSGASDTDNVVVDVLPPTSTSAVAVGGSGTTKVSGVSRSFSFSASTGSSTPSGSLSYVDTQNNKNVVATQITSVVVNGTDIRIFGKAKVNNSGSFDFVVTAKENSQVTPARADTFGITLSDGYTSGSRALASGDIVIGSAS